MDALNAKQAAERHFGTADLGHAARNKRAVRIARRISSSPQASIPKLCATKAESKATYAFMSNESVTHAALLSGHQQRTLDSFGGRERVLVIQDTMTASFGGDEREGLGPVNDAAGRWGMLVHTALAVSATDRRVLGVLDQQAWSRSTEKKPRDETAEQRRSRSRESERWPETIKRTAALCAERAIEPSRIIAVADRESDIFEVFEACDEVGCSFVLRATHNRLLFDDGEGGQQREYSLDTVRAATVIAHKTVRVPARGSVPARTARLQVRAMRVDVSPPKNRGRRGAPQWMNIVLVEEVDPPKKNALIWFLLTRESIAMENDVLTIVAHYEARWLIEEFHMGLKTGCALEKRQLESFHALTNFLAFATVNACLMLQLRDESRAPEPRPARDVLRPSLLLLLRRANPRLGADCTAREALRAIATLGGFYGSNKDAVPGWRTLSGGLQVLLEREAGYLAALEAVRTGLSDSVETTPSHKIRER